MILMKVFISWSGDTSRRVAELLRDWIPDVIQTIEPFLTVRDMEKGTRWFSEISEELEGSDHGIICVTPDNKEAPWIHFEAGALAKKVGKSKVCPLLINLEPHDLKGPLVQLQVTRDTREEFLLLFRSLNREIDKPLADERLKTYFDRTWDPFEKELEEIKGSVPASEETIRTEDDKLNEILEYVRREIRFAKPDIQFTGVTMGGSSDVNVIDHNYKQRQAGVKKELMEYMESTNAFVRWMIKENTVYFDSELSRVSEKHIIALYKIVHRNGFTQGEFDGSS